MITIYQDHNQNNRYGDLTVFLKLAIDNYMEARDAYVKLQLLAKDKETIINPIDNSQLEVPKLKNIDERFSLAHKLRRTEIQSLIFLAIFYEALICEIAITELGHAYFKDNIDRLNPMAKWEIVFKIIYGKGLDKSSQYYQHMKSIIGIRNELVHYKSKATIDNQTDIFLNIEQGIFTLKKFETDIKIIDKELGVISESIFPSYTLNQLNALSPVLINKNIGKSKMKYNVENVLKAHMPNLIKLLGEQRISWTSVNRALEKHINTIKKEYKSTGKGVFKDATFYSIIKNKIIGNNKSDGMFAFYNEIFGSLHEILSESEKKLIHKIIKDVLTNTNRDYLNFIGELATLNKFIQTGEYNLINIEEPINKEKGISADILLQRKEDNIEVLIEVLNVHLEVANFTNFEGLRNHLTSKFNKKKNEKDLISSSRIMFIQPVIWSRDEEQLKFICEFYSKTGFKMEGVIPAMTYATYRHQNGYLEHRFESVNTILEN